MQRYHYMWSKDRIHWSTDLQHTLAQSSFLFEMPYNNNSMVNSFCIKKLWATRNILMNCIIPFVRNIVQRGQKYYIDKLGVHQRETNLYMVVQFNSNINLRIQRRKIMSILLINWSLIVIGRNLTKFGYKYKYKFLPTYSALISRTWYMFLPHILKWIRWDMFDHRTNLLALFIKCIY